jgi:pimeloyl-ACP methyl ester carboxylesterase
LPSKYAQISGDAVHFLHTAPTSLPGVPPPLDRGVLFLFVHGAGRNAGDFRRLLDLLAPSHSAIAIDLPGHGRSPGLDALSSIEAYAEVLERFVVSIPRRRYVLVGWSMGALVALAASRHGPHGADGMVLMSCAPWGTIDDAALAPVRDVVRGRRPQIFDQSLFSPSTALDVMREAWMEQVKTDPRVLAGDLALAQRFDLDRHLGTLARPTLVVHGADDRIMPVARAEELARTIPASRFEVVERAGHIPQLEQPERIYEILTSFATGLA